MSRRDSQRRPYPKRTRYASVQRASTGSISVGLCADPRRHSFDQSNDLERFLEWMSIHEPQLGAVLAAHRTDVQDFLRVGDFAYGVQTASSTDRWCLGGRGRCLGC